MIPLAVLIVLLVFNISIFGSDSILGASQVALLVASGVCVALSMWLYKTPWEQFEGTIAKNVGSVASAILILFLIGAISGTWTMSGVVPAFLSGPLPAVMGRIQQAKIKVSNRFLFIAKSTCGFINYFEVSVYPRVGPCGDFHRIGAGGTGNRLGVGMYNGIAD